MTADVVGSPGPAAEADAELPVRLAALLAGLLGRDHVDPGEHFFETLGADSMVMARFCAKARKAPGVPTIGMQDIYEHPTLTALLTALAPAAEAVPPVPAPTPAPAVPPSAEVTAHADRVEAVGPRPGSPVLCGLAQALAFLGYTYLVAVAVTAGYSWLGAAPDLLALYGRSVLAGVAGFGALAVTPVVVKWLLVGRWREERFAVWSVRYLRFWVVKTLVRSNPLALLVGSPLYVLYLRALGARIGPGAVILSARVPVCTDLISVGADSVIRKECFFSGYRAVDGVIETGRVTLGRDVSVGEMTVLDVGASLGDGSTLGHTSSLHSGQQVPASARFHGSPARATDVDYRVIPTTGRSGRLRRLGYTAAELALLVGLVLPVLVGGTTELVRVAPWLLGLIDPPVGAITQPWFWAQTLAVSLVAYLGGLVVLLVVATTLPRLLAWPLRDGEVRPVYGVHYFLHRLVVRLTNLLTFVALFGDSSAIAHYLRAVGFDLRPLAQTGSNFGMAVTHETPYLATVGRGTVVADGLSMMTADYTASSFRVGRAAVGAFNFLGNKVAYPIEGRTGDDCLLATKVMVPVSGPVREGVGLLGSPCFEIPRTVARDARLAWGTPLERRRALTAKNRHNGLSMVLHLVVRWGFFVGLAVLTALVATIPVALGALEITMVEVLVLVWLVGWYALVARLFNPLQQRAPDGLSIYDPAFWRHERFWKVPAPDFVQLFNGTPFKTGVWRLLGARVGRRVFDDGANLTEKSFTTIGDGTTLNEGVVIQCHSQEDGAFKSDHVVIGAGVTLGVGAFLHYGTSIGDGAELAPDSFLMKGGEIPPGETWGGNPARPLPDPAERRRA